MTNPTAMALEEWEQLKKDAQRFEFVLPIINVEGAEGDRRAVLVCKQFARGLQGRAAIDAAMAEHQGKEAAC